MTEGTQEARSMPGPETPQHPWDFCIEIDGCRICISLGSGPTVPGSEPTTRLAIAAGEIHGKIFRELMRRYESAGKDERRYRKAAIRDLLSAKMIRAHETELLDEVVEITAATGRDIDVQRLRQIFERLVDEDGSPMAVAISSIALNSGAAQTSAGGGVAGADVGGAIGGGILGGLGGAALGAGLASFGAAVGSQA